MSNNIEGLRQRLFETIDAVRNNSIDLDKAKVISDLSQVIVNSAKVEVDFLRVTDGAESDFLRPALKVEQVPAGITGRTIHRIG